jgi:hypothetical protein
MAIVKEGTVVETTLIQEFADSLVFSITLAKYPDEPVDSDIETLVSVVELALEGYALFFFAGLPVPDELEQVLNIIDGFIDGDCILSVEDGKVVYSKMPKLEPQEKCAQCNSPVCQLSLPNRTRGMICLN